MPLLVLINGAPGAGKSTLAHGLAEQHPADIALDIDEIKRSLDQWADDLTAAGYRARTLALVTIGEELSAGNSVFVGQFLAKSEFIKQLEDAALAHGATFVEIFLVADVDRLRGRLAQRTTNPERPTDDEVPEIVDGLARLLAS